MKKAYLALIGAAVMPMTMMGQGAIEALNISRSDFKGTARFMSMGGAFTALGGDLSTLNQNPAGIGVYRSSEVGVTVDFNIQNTKTPQMSMNFPFKDSQTKVYCNNFGYVGATNLDGALKTFNWGVTYNRATSFDRKFRGFVPTMETSLSNYIASFSNGIVANDMLFNDSEEYDPYLDSDIDWLSILAYNSYMINPTGPSSTGVGSAYEGLFNRNSSGDVLFDVRERGYVDEYNISFGGNVENVVYWGLSIGITDLQYTRDTYYSESLANANVPAKNGVTNGSFMFDLNNRQDITGSGWNIKAGVILKPINEFRIGLAVHTPTWYSLTQEGYATNDYTYTPTDIEGVALGEPTSANEYSDLAHFQWKFSSPWRLMVGMAGVIGNRAIVSLDYEFKGYNNMSVKNPSNYDGWGGYDYQTNEYVKADIKDYYKASNTVRLGLEYRITPQLSARAGYNVTTSCVKDEAYDGLIDVNTTGMDPSYTFDKTVQNVSFGLGYRYQAWYIDAAYVYTHRDSKYHAFTDFESFRAPVAKVVDNNSSIVVSTGFKF